MSSIHFNKDLQCNGCRILRLENKLLSVEVMPEVGGKIYSLFHKPENREYLWRHPNVQPAVVPPGTSYDDNFSGCWDEQFPNDEPCDYQGNSYPDHGELWTQRAHWDIKRSDDSITLYTCVETPVTKCRMERWLTLTVNSTVIRFKHRLSNLSDRAIDYIWKFHPALTVTGSHEILIPARAGLIAEPGSGRLSANTREFIWPHVPGHEGQTIDLSKVPDKGGEIEFRDPGYEMVYLTELTAGWCAVLDHSTRTGFGLAFDKKLFNNIWLFQTFGGWQGLHVAVLEPSTGYPYNLAEAAQNGRTSRLVPGQVIETHTMSLIFSNQDKINQINLDGSIR